MYAPLPGTGRRIQVGDGYPVTVTETMQQACNTYTWASILEKEKDEHGDWCRDVAADALISLRNELRAQVADDPRDRSTAFEAPQLVRIAKWLGCWDVDRGHAKSSPSIVPVRTVMDIPTVPECKAHGLMHDCPEV